MYQFNNKLRVRANAHGQYGDLVSLRFFVEEIKQYATEVILLLNISLNICETRAYHVAKQEIIQSKHNI
jgi:hypothetical protein